MLPVIRRVARSRTATEMNEAIKSLKNSEFWKIEKNYMMKYWLPLTEVSMVDMPLYGEIFIFLYVLSIFLVPHFLHDLHSLYVQ